MKVKVQDGWYYTKASLREIASRADVSVALVARYFGSKEKLFETVLDDSLTRTRLWGEHMWR